MSLRSAEYQRGYDAGYKQALLDALSTNRRDGADIFIGPGPHRRLDEVLRQTGRKIRDNGR